MSKEILIRKGWSMISYPDEVVISSLNIQPSNPITEGWYWYPENDGVPTYDTDLIYNSSTQPENREYIERIYVDESCSFPNGRFYKVFSMFPGRGYLVLNRGEDTTLSIPDENSFNKSLGGNQITLYKGWNAISTPKNNESFILQPEISTNSEIIWHWEQHQQPSINVSLLYGDGETPTFQDITKSNQEGCLYPSGRQYSADKMMTGFGYLINNITNTNITWTVPDVPIPAGNLQIVSGTGGYDVTAFSEIQLTRALKINKDGGLGVVVDIYNKNDDGGFGNSLAESTWSNKHPSSNFTNGLPDFNIYLENATETTAELWIQSNNPNNNGINNTISNIFFILKNNISDIDKDKITWYNFDETAVNNFNTTYSDWVTAKQTYDDWPTSTQFATLLSVGLVSADDPYGNSFAPSNPGPEPVFSFENFKNNSQISPYDKAGGQMTTSTNPDPLCWLRGDVIDLFISIPSNSPIQLGYIKYTE